MEFGFRIDRVQRYAFLKERKKARLMLNRTCSEQVFSESQPRARPIEGDSDRLRSRDSMSSRAVQMEEKKRVKNERWCEETKKVKKIEKCKRENGEMERDTDEKREEKKRESTPMENDEEKEEERNKKEWEVMKKKETNQDQENVDGETENAKDMNERRRENDTDNKNEKKKEKEPEHDEEIEKEKIQREWEEKMEEKEGELEEEKKTETDMEKERESRKEEVRDRGGNETTVNGQRNGQRKVDGMNEEDAKEDGVVKDLACVEASKDLMTSSSGDDLKLSTQLALASEKRTDRHDMEISRDSATLGNSFRQCTKNPGHEDFIPVNRFGGLHLPACSRQRSLVAYIKALSKLTVHLAVSFTSEDRPRHFPCANIRGTNLRRFASGFAWVPGDIRPIECPLQPCPHNGQKHSVYGPIRILTNKHVIYDQSEAVEAAVHFFFDHSASRHCVEVAHGVTLDFSCFDSDRAHLLCYTHNATLSDILVGHMETVRALYEAIPASTWDECMEMSVVISHPHGMAKRISVGRYHRFEAKPTSTHAHFYDTATCPGSSGAPVFYFNRQEKGAHPMWLPAVHSHYSHSLDLNCGFK